MKLTFALKLALLGFFMIILFIYSTTNAFSLGPFKYVAIITGLVFFPAGIQMISRNLKRAKANHKAKKLRNQQKK